MLGLRLHQSPSFGCCSRRGVSTRFQPGDYAIITPLKKTVSKKQWLSRPLKDLPNANVNLNFGKIPHAELIGASPLGKVHTIETKKKLAKYTCSLPSLEQWITLSARKAQPIYSFDAQAIVSLTDLQIGYPEPPADEGGKITPLQFLEAGTGHGSLTLAISKVLHPANALAYYAKDPNLRGAVLHTIDCNGSHSITGKRTVKGFRRGMYLDNIEFHVSDSPSQWVSSPEGQDWLETELVSKKEQALEYDPDEPDAFLSGVFLDMPNYHGEMVKLAPYIKSGGFIIVFCPSITQIIDAIDAIAEENVRLSQLDPPTSLHLEHERTVQLLDGAGGGLKEWDTRRTLIRATGKFGYSVRPKVGVRSVAGGFVAIWRKMGREVNLELERELMESFEGKPDPSEELNNDEAEGAEVAAVADVAESAESDVVKKEVAQNTPIVEASSASKSSEANHSRLEKSKMFAPDLLSTAPEVFEDAAQKDEEYPAEEKTQEIADTDVNDGFKVEEATLIPHSVLNTVFHSCHGDPDIHVGYISDVFLMATPAPEGLDLADSTTPTSANSASSATPNVLESESETVMSQDSPANDDTAEAEEKEESAHEEWKPKAWQRHTF
ncbi:hypothetical protein PMKS-002816 [Pichia membranifaciens]|uniref:tRNA (adenine(58)-N(1))-methyltransferase catalytic subunit TRM61 n=1 Tax=Pichia membranifaciens TaxID=4926 RepID=A0A1Q2YIG6_9ASCO|nr:hypothetical protein PMKS-002816 [Pichia membranifaciens]